MTVLPEVPARRQRGSAAGPASGARVPGLDRVRGLAIVLMLGDHAGLLVPHGDVYRFTLGRVAAPLFFVLGGYLCRRLTARHVQAFALGVGLPLVAPWVDSPNVLVWWSLGCVLLVVSARLRVPRWLLVMVPLGLGANGWLGFLGPSTFDPVALWGCMALGAMLPASAWSWSSRLPAWLGAVGRHPLVLYVGQTVLVEALLVMLRGWPAPAPLGVVVGGALLGTAGLVWLAGWRPARREAS